MDNSRKILTAGLAAWVAHQPTGLKLKGSPDKVKVVEEALIASRNFRDELCKESANMETVVRKLDDKRAAAKKFEKVMGFPWPL